MSKISYASLKLKPSIQTKTFTWGEGEDKKEIEVSQYLSIGNKIDLIDITLQKAREENLYNVTKLDMYFHLHLVYMYTNIYFTEKQKEDEEKIYDALESSGMLTEIIKNMNVEEYNDLWDKIIETTENQLKYNTTAAALVKSLIDDLPTNAKIAMDVVNNFDPDKFKAVKEFAEAANGNRDIVTNLPVGQ